jgi:hypothetical protein
MKSPADAVVVIGLALGAVFGMLGTFVSDAGVRAVSWGIDGTGLVAATGLLALRYFRRGNDLVAGGFLVFAIGEGVIVSGAAQSLAASVPSFGAGTALWSAALLLTCIPKEFALWTRVAGMIGAVLFAVVSLRIFWGEQLLPVASPLPFFAYPFLVLAFAGWAWAVLKTRDSAR